MLDDSAERPRLSRALSGAELRRWYWLKDELVVFTRQLGVRSSGGKDARARRITAFLDGTSSDEPPTTSRPRPHLANPEGARAELLAAWREYRRLPRDVRTSETWISEGAGTTDSNVTTDS